MPTYSLNANQCPVPVTPAALLNPSGGVPTTAPALADGDTDQLRTKFNTLACDLDVVGRYGGGGYAIVTGLDLSVVSGLSLQVAAGQALLDGPKTIPTAQTVAITDNIARTYLYLSQGGAIVQVLNSLTPPSGAHAFLGSVVSSGGAITQVDASGVMVLRGGTLWRQTADTATPTDTPPATLQFVNKGSGKTWWWDGTQYKEWGGYVPGGTDVAVADGGTGASDAPTARTNLSAAAFGQLVLQPAGNVTLTAAQARDYSNIELRSGGGVAAAFTVEWPAGMTAAKEWVIANTTGQPCALKVTGGTELWLGNDQRRTVYFDGTELRESGRAAPTFFARADITPKTFSVPSEIQGDYIEFTPVGSGEYRWPNASMMGQRGLTQVIKNDDTSEWILVKTNGASLGTSHLPGEIISYVIDSAGGIVRANTRPYTQVVSIAMPDSDYTVAHPDFLAVFLRISGTLTAPRNLVLPTVTDHAWCVVNGTGQTITVKTAAGTGIALANNKSQWFFCEGTNILPAGGPS